MCDESAGMPIINLRTWLKHFNVMQARLLMCVCGSRRESKKCMRDSYCRAFVSRSSSVIGLLLRNTLVEGRSSRLHVFLSSVYCNCDTLAVVMGSRHPSLVLVLLGLKLNYSAVRIVLLGEISRYLLLIKLVF